MAKPGVISSSQRPLVQIAKTKLNWLEQASEAWRSILSLAHYSFLATFEVTFVTASRNIRCIDASMPVFDVRIITWIATLRR